MLYDGLYIQTSVYVYVERENIEKDRGGKAFD